GSWAAKVENSVVVFRIAADATYKSEVYTNRQLVSKGFGIFISAAWHDMNGEQDLWAFQGFAAPFNSDMGTFTVKLDDRRQVVAIDFTSSLPNGKPMHF